MQTSDGRHDARPDAQHDARDSDRRAGRDEQSSGEVGSAARVDAGLELLAAWALLEVVIWIPGTSVWAAWRLLPAALLVLVVGRSLYRRRAVLLPAPRASIGRAWSATLLATALATAAVFGMAWLGGHLGHRPSVDALALEGGQLVRWVAGKVLVVSVQQLGLQLFALPLCREVLGSRGAAIAASAALFGALHLPNTLLSVLTGVAAVGWCLLHLYTGRLLPLVVSHGLLALVARSAFDDAIYNMRVGAAVLPLMPVTLVAPDGGELRVRPLALDGFVDACRPQGEHHVCVGWAADVDRQDLAQAIVVMAGGSIHYYPIMQRPRPDVAAHFGVPALAESGFQLRLPSRWLESEAGIRVFASGRAGRVSELQYGAEVPGRPASEDQASSDGS